MARRRVPANRGMATGPRSGAWRRARAIRAYHERVALPRRQQVPGVQKVRIEHVLAGPQPPVRVTDGTGRPEAHIGEAERWFGGVGVVPPPAGAWVDVVVGEQPVPVAGDEVDGVDDVVTDAVGDEVVEVDPGPAGFDALRAVGELVTRRRRWGGVAAGQPVAVGARAGAAAVGLDAEQVVEQRDHEVVGQEPAVVADPEGNDGQAARRGAAEQFDGGVGVPAGAGAPPEPFLACLNQAGADGLLQREHQAGANGFDDRGGSAFFACHRVLRVTVAGRIGGGHGAAARLGRHPVGEEVPAHDKDAGRLRPAHELVRGKEHRVLVVAAAWPGPGHPDRHMGRRGRVVPHRQCAITVQQRRDPAGVAEDAGHVRGGGETSDEQWPAGVADDLALEVGEVDLAISVRADGHHVRERFPPGQVAGMVLFRANEHGRAPARRNVRGQPGASGPPGRVPQPENCGQLGHRRRAARSAEDDQVVVRAADRVADELPGVRAQPCGLQAGTRTFGVRAGAAGKHLLADEVLDEPQRPPRRGVVGVNQPPRAVGTGQHLIVADDAPPDPFDQRRARRGVAGRRHAPGRRL